MVVIVISETKIEIEDRRCLGFKFRGTIENMNLKYKNNIIKLNKLTLSLLVCGTNPYLLLDQSCSLTATSNQNKKVKL